MNNKLTNWAFWLSIIAIITSSSVAALWLVKAQEVAVVQLDTFVGIIVALMALLVTIVLGWQIYNAVDIKEKIMYTENLKLELEQSKAEFKQSDIRNAFYHNLALAMCSQLSRDYSSAFYFFIHALLRTLQLEQPIDVKPTLGSLDACVQSLGANAKIEQAKYNQIIETDKKIRASKQYALFQEDYEKTYNAFIDKITVPKSK